MIKKFKNTFKIIVLIFINTLIKPSNEIKQNSLLLIRLDAIGDYVLFRNYIEVLKKSEKYKDYSITLLGNSVWESLSEEFDSEFVDRFIWLDRKKFHKNFFYRLQKLKDITSNGYEIVVSPVYSREFFYADNIVKLVNAKEKIGSIGDLSNIKKWQKNLSDKYYTRLITAKSEIMFEFNRNKEFFEQFLGVELEIYKPTIKLQNKKLRFELPKNYAILFIGASANYRKWSIERFAKIAKYLISHYEYEIVLCGGLSDNKDAKEFENFYDDEFLNLVGKTSLVDLLNIIHSGNIMIANETSAPHFAAALEVKNIFVIFNGNHYGRFTPYPKEMGLNYHVIYHPVIEKDLDEYKRLSNSYGFGSDLDINEISFEMVKNKIDEVLNK